MRRHDSKPDRSRSPVRNVGVHSVTGWPVSSSSAGTSGVSGAASTLSCSAADDYQWSTLEEDGVGVPEQPDFGKTDCYDSSTGLDSYEDEGAGFSSSPVFTGSSGGPQWGLVSAAVLQ